MNIIQESVNQAKQRWDQSHCDFHGFIIQSLGVWLTLFENIRQIPNLINYFAIEFISLTLNASKQLTNLLECASPWAMVFFYRLHPYHALRFYQEYHNCSYFSYAITLHILCINESKEFIWYRHFGTFLWSTTLIWFSRIENFTMTFFSLRKVLVLFFTQYVL